jgi:outer membrane receptor protein involved in Fe transport
MKNTCLIICIFWLSIFSLHFIQAQNNDCTITGAILDKNSNAPLFYVNTGLLNATDSTEVSVSTTDKDGIFTFSKVKSGNYIIKTHYAGYETYRQNLTVDGENKTIQMDVILLQPIATQLQSVEVAVAKPVYMNDGEKILYNVSEDAGVQTGTVADALQNAPGVEVDIEGNITLRGISSVEIWINDRPSKLKEENLKTYLQQLPANAVERIEVITNPSARYTAKSDGGIINIVTKSKIQKNSFISFGLNGSTRPMASPWFSYMFSNEKFSINLYLNGYYYFMKRKSNGYSTLFTEKMDTASYRSYTGNEKWNSISTNNYLQGSYNIDSLKTISFYGGVWIQPLQKNTHYWDYIYREYLDNPGIYDYTANAVDNGYFWDVEAGMEYEHNFNDEGHTLVTALYFDYWEENRKNSLQRIYHQHPELNKNKKITDKYKSYAANFTIDYSLPFLEEGLIEMGFEGDFEGERRNNRTDTLYHFSEIYGLDSMRSYNFIENNKDIEAYITARYKFGNFTLKGGLRSQSRIFNYKTINSSESRGNKTYTGLYPSLHLTYSTKSMHNFNLSYTRKVRYPWSSQINTFIFYDEDSYSTGNPNLKSTYTNSVEGGWTKYFKKFGNVGLSAYFRNLRNERNNFTDVIYSDFFGRYVTCSSYINSGKSHQYGADLNVMYKLKEFMNITLNAGIYQYHNETRLREDENPVITNNLGYNFKLIFWAKLWKFLEINASGYYRSKTKNVYIEYASYYAINCGLRSDFWKKKISVFLNVQDIFNWGKSKNTNTNPYYIAYNSTKYNSRYVSAGITFRFGKIEMESRAKTGGNTE